MCITPYCTVSVDIVNGLVILVVEWETYFCNYRTIGIYSVSLAQSVFTNNLLFCSTCSSSAV